MEGKQVVPVTPRTARRSFTTDFKRELVRQAMLPDVSRAALALANGINAHQLARWCREHQRADHLTFVPVVSAVPTASAYALAQSAPVSPTEIEWRHGDT
ncbi:transposase [Herbaspirillum sp. RTI4]|nr:transposase [Herbaspirillum sp. RTI4]MDY7579313.1 transposase [Herbaspirillum sp. RTI4]MEA9980227.1 transposase [Herbaspirillum sp. RTI4]